MNMPKAIEIGQDILHFVEPGDPPEEHDAIKLLIEAGKYIEKWHDQLIAEGFSPLPGETEE